MKKPVRNDVRRFWDNVSLKAKDLSIVVTPKKSFQKCLVILRDYLVALAFLIKTFKVNECVLLQYHHFKSCLFGTFHSQPIDTILTDTQLELLPYESNDFFLEYSTSFSSAFLDSTTYWVLVYTRIQAVLAFSLSRLYEGHSEQQLLSCTCAILQKPRASLGFRLLFGDLNPDFFSCLIYFLPSPKLNILLVPIYFTACFHQVFKFYLLFHIVSPMIWRGM